jgi:hypothetical protein
MHWLSVSESKFVIIMNDIQAGDHVVCIDGKFPPLVAKLYKSIPLEDGHYVIRDIRLGIQLDCKTGDASVLLVGMINPPQKGKSQIEPGFSISRFRKLDELKGTSKQEQKILVKREISVKVPT